MTPWAVPGHSSLSLLGKKFRLGDSHDATVTGVAVYSDHSTQLQLTWWHAGLRQQAWCTQTELGPEVLPAPAFGFRASSSEVAQ